MKTYFIADTKGYDKTNFFKNLDKYYKRVYNPTYADLVYLEFPFNKDFLKIKYKLRNYADNTEPISNKSLLYTNLEKLGNNPMPKTLIINYNTKLPINIENYPVIVKCSDDWAFADAGNKICNNYDEIEDFIINYVGEEYSIQEYLVDIDLYEGYKYHLRGYYILYHGGWTLLKKMEIITAKDKYKNKDWNNKDIHDSHRKSTSGTFICEDIDVIKQCYDICAQLYKIYKVDKNIFHIFGVDFMVLRNKKVKLIECNHNPGFKMLGNDLEGYIKHSNYFYDEVFKIIYRNL